ncbi:hypothetical protein PPERSA_11847 [Pseudocohnilembus persalinus]|uniref:Uncharacterized protein n=1 Tax=Pseudocohnilembus persalinus TaxID=266149 RepID=A0A0V0QJZ5_PSEPJ|nr:hypothetical protein PPERSA_11847 [Pseudocohnilembus persalinus]|eukprot:KRX02507.1 hypothetical protein PPERSA_11847 [Pseudocohnilembus persalinus]
MHPLQRSHYTNNPQSIYYNKKTGYIYDQNKIPQTSPILNNNSLMGNSGIYNSQSQIEKSYIQPSNVSYSDIYNQSTNSGAKLTQSNLIASKPRVYMNESYRDEIFGLGMSNVHSVSSLRHSVPRYPVQYQKRWKPIQYEGFDPDEWKPKSIFISKQEKINIEKSKGPGLVKGATMTNLKRAELDEQWRGNPGPGQYERPILKDKFQLKLEQIKKRREQDRKLQLGSYNNRYNLLGKNLGGDQQIQNNNNHQYQNGYYRQNQNQVNSYKVAQRNNSVNQYDYRGRY